MIHFSHIRSVLPVSVYLWLCQRAAKCLLAATIPIILPLLFQFHQRSVSIGLRALSEENLLNHAWLGRPDRVLPRQKTTKFNRNSAVSVCTCDSNRLKVRMCVRQSQQDFLTSIFMAIMTISGSPTVTLSPAFTSTWTQNHRFSNFLIISKRNLKS